MSAGPETPRDPATTPLRDPAVDAAYQRVTELYRVVRHEVYDRYPKGLPPAEDLTPAERAHLDELRQAEEALDELRRRWHLG